MPAAALCLSLQILCIHLKRFRHEVMYSFKISSHVSFPLEGLDLRPFLAKECVSQITTYDLLSVICHHGTAGSESKSCSCASSSPGQVQHQPCPLLPSLWGENQAAPDGFLQLCQPQHWASPDPFLFLGLSEALPRADKSGWQCQTPLLLQRLPEQEWAAKEVMDAPPWRCPRPGCLSSLGSGRCPADLEVAPADLQGPFHPNPFCELGSLLSLSLLWQQLVLPVLPSSARACPAPCCQPQQPASAVPQVGTTLPTART